LIVVAPDVNGALVRFLFYLISWLCLLFFPHCLAHFIVGRLAGVRFSHYVIGKSSITKLRLPVISAVAVIFPLLKLRIDRRSLRSVNDGARAATFASGAVASMILPFLVPVVSFGRLPVAWSLGLILLSLANVCFDLYYSPKAGDLSRI
jgi:hypothetical protein